jgi:hypothetical protein
MGQIVTSRNPEQVMNKHTVFPVDSDLRIRAGERRGNPKAWSVRGLPTYPMLWNFALSESDFM